jgi:cytochrome c
MAQASGVGDRLVWRAGHARDARTRETVGSYWPYAPTLFDYIRRAMPQNAPESLAMMTSMRSGLHPPSERTAAGEATLDARTLSAIKMPNRKVFVGDSRPDVKNPACMTGCGGSK